MELRFKKGKKTWWITENYETLIFLKTMVRCQTKFLNKLYLYNTDLLSKNYVSMEQNMVLWKNYDTMKKTMVA